MEKDSTVTEPITKTQLEIPSKTTQPSKKLCRIQKLIGQRMSKSKASKPCFYIETKADVTDLTAARPSLRKSCGVKITTNAFYIRALALAAKQYPLVLGRFGGDSIKIADSINVGFAVNAPQGLVVPVIKQADTKSLPQIAQMEKLLTEKARSNKLTLQEMEDETIALSNLGVYGIDSFIGIVPPSASTILAVGNIIQTVDAAEGGLQVRKKVSLTLAADYRVIDYFLGARFLGVIKQLLSNCRQLL